MLFCCFCVFGFVCVALLLCVLFFLLVVDVCFFVCFWCRGGYCDRNHDIFHRYRECEFDHNVLSLQRRDSDVIMVF